MSNMWSPREEEIACRLGTVRPSFEVARVLDRPEFEVRGALRRRKAKRRPWTYADECGIRFFRGGFI